MPVPGYDPDDLDQLLADRMEGRDASNWLTDEQLCEYEAGGSLVDLLDEEDIHELLGAEDGGVTEEDGSVSNG